MDVLQDLFESSLQRTLYAKTATKRVLPTLMEAASSAAVLAALTEQFEITKRQLKRLQEVFVLLGVNGVGEECLAIDGHVLEAQQHIAKTQLSPLRDAALIGSVLSIQYFEMARYEMLRACAGELGLHEASRILQKSLTEVKATVARLSVLAAAHINMLVDSGADDLEQISPEARYLGTTLKLSGWQQPPAFTGL